MNILQNRVEPTASQQTLIDIETKTQTALVLLHEAVVSGFRATWYGDVSTAELLADMGTNAVAVFDRHALAVQLLLASGVQMNPEDYMPPADRPYTRHENGVITLN